MEFVCQFVDHVNAHDTHKSSDSSPEILSVEGPFSNLLNQCAIHFLTCVVIQQIRVHASDRCNPCLFRYFWTRSVEQTQPNPPGRRIKLQQKRGSTQQSTPQCSLVLVLLRYCSVLLCVAARQYVTVWFSGLQRVAVCCRVLQWNAKFCSMLQSDTTCMHLPTTDIVDTQRA